MAFIDEIKGIPITDYARSLGYTVERLGRYYTLKEHDSVRIDPGKNRFWRNSNGAGGSVIDFAIEFGDAPSVSQAIVELKSRYDLHVDRETGGRRPKPREAAPEGGAAKALALPPRAGDNKAAYMYLVHQRGIDIEVFKHLEKRGHIYQDDRRNCVFVGYNDGPAAQPEAAKAAPAKGATDWSNSVLTDFGKRYLALAETVAGAWEAKGAAAERGLDGIRQGTRLWDETTKRIDIYEGNHDRIMQAVQRIRDRQPSFADEMVVKLALDGAHNSAADLDELNEALRRLPDTDYGAIDFNAFEDKAEMMGYVGRLQKAPLLEQKGIAAKGKGGAESEAAAFDFSEKELEAALRGAGHFEGMTAGDSAGAAICAANAARIRDAVGKVSRGGASRADCMAVWLGISKIKVDYGAIDLGGFGTPAEMLDHAFKLERTPLPEQRGGAQGAREAVFASVRGTGGKRFLADVPGSDYGQCIFVNGGAGPGNAPDTLIVTESFIDAMSHMSAEKIKGNDFRQYSYLALGGVQKTQALFNHLKNNPAIREVRLAFDNDRAGREAAEALKDKIIADFGDSMGHVAVSVNTPDAREGVKDWNDELARLNAAKPGRGGQGQPRFTMENVNSGIAAKRGERNGSQGEGGPGEAARAAAPAKAERA